MGLRTQLCRKILPYAIKKGYGEEMLEMVQALQKAKKTELFAHDMVYHPMKTNSTFYLPYAVTDWIQRKIFVTDNYFEYKNLNYIFRTFRGGAIAEAVQNRTILDIGANIGNHTCYFMNEIKKNDASGKCICFEVMPSTAELLKKNLALNHLEERTVVYPFGLGNKKMHASSIHYDLWNIGGNTIAENREGNLEVRTLDSLKLTDDIAFIKMDVERMEIAVLEGAEELLGRCHPYLMMEVFDDAYPKVRAIMDRFGYDEEHIDYADYLFYPKD